MTAPTEGQKTTEAGVDCWEGMDCDSREYMEFRVRRELAKARDWQRRLLLAPATRAPVVASTW